ncbi:hypothetical protein ABPG77_006933 [Micractinium sp. CCAP 211/92]
MSDPGSGSASSQGLSPEEQARAHIAAEIAKMTPEQRQALHAQALEVFMKRRRVQTADGKTVSLARLKRRVDELTRRFESGAYDETARSLPRWQVQELTPGHTIRQGAYKMQLREREEAELELDRFGYGVVLSPRPVVGTLLRGTQLGSRRDFAWGIYARTANAERALSGTWAGQDPEKVLEDERFYIDVMRYAHQMELTLTVLTSRPLPLAATRQHFADKLESSMKQLTGKPELPPADKAALTNFISLFDDDRVSQAGWVDAKKGMVKKGTHFLFSTTPEGKLAVEAITPGRLKEKRTSYIGVNPNSLLTGAVFGVFLGPQPIDDIGKRDVGHGMLWAAHGFRFRPWEAKPEQMELDIGPDGQPVLPQPPCEQLELPLRPTVFQMLDEQTKPLRRTLLGGIRRAQRQSARSAAADAAAA